MMIRVGMAALLALVLNACGVKTGLDYPDGAKQDKSQIDPSMPPHPIGQ